MVNDCRSGPLERARRCATIAPLQLLLQLTLGSIVMSLSPAEARTPMAPTGHHSNVKPQTHSIMPNTTRS